MPWYIPSQLTGQIPSELAEITGLDLLGLDANTTYLNMSSNVISFTSGLQHLWLTGTVPQDLMCLSSLYSFTFDRAHLSGNDTEAFCNATGFPIECSNDTCSFGFQGSLEREAGTNTSDAATLDPTPKPTEDTSNAELCSGDEELVTCSEGAAVPMGYVCHYNEETASYETLCVNIYAGGILIHGADYCGECVRDSFVKDAVRHDVPTENGIEFAENYKVDYHVSFNENGLVSLAAAFDLIASIDCGQGFISIQFKRNLSADQLNYMFPQSALLVVDGATFSTVCYFGIDPDFTPLTDNGFLTIQDIDLSGRSVTIRGEEAFYNHIFQEQAISYEELPDRRHLAELEVKVEDSKSFGPIAVEPSLTINSAMRMKFLKKDWNLWSRSIDLKVAFGWETKIEIENKISISEAFCTDVDEKWKKTWPFVDIPVPSASFKLPNVSKVQ